jgi:hypothetical protein
VAVKVLEYNLGAAARVQNELDCALLLRHANVVGAYVTITYATPEAAAQLDAASPDFAGSLRNFGVALSHGQQQQQQPETIAEEPSALQEQQQQQGPPPAGGRGLATEQQHLSSPPSTTIGSSMLALQLQLPPSKPCTSSTGASTSFSAGSASTSCSSSHSQKEVLQTAGPSSSSGSLLQPGRQGQAQEQHAGSSRQARLGRQPAAAQQPAEAPKEPPLQSYQLQMSGSRRNITDIYPTGGTGSQYGMPVLVAVIAMDFCDGGPLSDIAGRMACDPLDQKLVGS